MTRCLRDLGSLPSLFALAVFASTAGCSPSPPAVSSPQPAANVIESGDSPVIARVGAREITLAELDAWIEADILEREFRSKPEVELYEMRDAALQAMLGEIVVEALAEQEGTTPEAVLEAEAAKLGSVTDEEVASFYEQNKAQLGGASLEDIGPRIRAFLQAQKIEEAHGALLEAAEVAILLDPPRAQIAAKGPSRGPEDAPVTIVEFSDYECPFCARVEPVIAALLERYPSEVRFVYRHMPLSFHPNAQPAAEAAICAEEQGRFWEYHALLFEDQKALNAANFRKYAKDLGLDEEAFDRCLAESAPGERVEADIAEARAAGASGTPAFFINGIFLGGAQPLESFVEVVEAELARQSSDS